ncbi:cob(I)yrinic acid a,c-diamide adenosyltransferase [Candidatus Auribacterota bacterium]
MSATKIVKKINSKRFFPYMPSKIAKDIPLGQLTALEEASPSLPGIIIEVEPVRYYKYHNFLTHLLGTVGKISKSQYDLWREKGYTQNDIVGKSGVEAAYESYLRGIQGGMQVQVDNKGFFDEIINIREPIPGNNLYLSIDKRVQEALEEVYSDKTGAGVVINPNNGEILAMLSKPDFDPNIFVGHTSADKINALFQDPKVPLLNKALLSKSYDLVILDEINIALYYKLIDLNDLIALINEKPAEVELVITGRNVPEEIIDKADLVTEMKEIKHYYSQGVQARKGIEN